MAEFCFAQSGFVVAIALLTGAAGCHSATTQTIRSTAPNRVSVTSPVAARMMANCAEQTKVTRQYDPAYLSLTYPGGDPPLTTGVCADVIIRAFRAGGVDLQKEVHEDMARHFAAYPKLWGLKRPDSNIDHRRVANLMVYFQRKGKALPVSAGTGNYLPGDVVAWRLRGGRLHIGVVSDQSAPGSGRPLIFHNIGAGANCEDVLMAWPIIGHYCYFSKTDNRQQT